MNHGLGYSSHPPQTDDAEREELASQLQEIDETGWEMYLEIAKFILTDRQTQKQKWVEEVKARLPINLNGNVFKQEKMLFVEGFNAASTAWRAALRGESK